MMAPGKDPSLKPLQHHGNIVERGLRWVYNWALIMPRGLSLFSTPEEEIMDWRWQVSETFRLEEVRVSLFFSEAVWVAFVSRHNGGPIEGISLTPWCHIAEIFERVSGGLYWTLMMPSCGTYVTYMGYKIIYISYWI